LKQFEYITPKEVDKKWDEYKTDWKKKHKSYEMPSFEDFGDFLRELGKDGWEISASSCYPAGTDYFGKREITPERSNSYVRSSQDMER
jgi:hypothetical protein